MGCDIHLYKEKMIGGKWVAADEWVPSPYEDDEGRLEVPFEKRFHGRNYNLFGLLAKGVRAEHPYSFEPRGLPFNACSEVKAENDSWGCDGHNQSYLYLHELREMRAYLDTVNVRIEGMKDRTELEALHESIATGSPDWKLIFPYCAMTNNPRCVAFEMDVPASFYLGGSLDEIISSFDGIEGDNHRIVFWFDN